MVFNCHVLLRVPQAICSILYISGFRYPDPCPLHTRYGPWKQSEHTYRARNLKATVSTLFSITFSITSALASCLSIFFLAFDLYSLRSFGFGLISLNGLTIPPFSNTNIHLISWHIQEKDCNRSRGLLYCTHVC